MTFLKSHQKPLTYLITKGDLTDENFETASEETLEIIKYACRKKIDFIQIREKKISSKKSFDIAKKAVRIAEKSQTKILVNERFDIAIASGADGVHLTSKSLPVRVLRDLVDEKFIIGKSIHNVAEAEIAYEQKADFITFSPVFETISKKQHGEAKGLSELQKICEKLKDYPVIALGGLELIKFDETIEAGAHGFAGIGFFNSRENLDKISVWKENFLQKRTERSV